VIVQHRAGLAAIHDLEAIQYTLVSGELQCATDDGYTIIEHDEGLASFGRTQGVSDAIIDACVSLEIADVVFEYRTSYVTRIVYYQLKKHRHGYNADKRLLNSSNIGQGDFVGEIDLTCDRFLTLPIQFLDLRCAVRLGSNRREKGGVFQVGLALIESCLKVSVAIPRARGHVEQTACWVGPHLASVPEDVLSKQSFPRQVRSSN
jgi:hypothetical protein